MNSQRPLTLREANQIVAQLGGYAGRRHDGEPGSESLALGLRRLHDVAWGWRMRGHYDIAN